jgi:hypothetical protein
VPAFRLCGADDRPRGARRRSRPAVVKLAALLASGREARRPLSYFDLKNAGDA